MAVIRGWMKRSQRLLDHDPEIDKFKTLWRAEHLKESDFAVLAGLSVQTVHKMFDGQTKRPQPRIASVSSASKCGETEVASNALALAKQRAKKNGKGK